MTMNEELLALADKWESMAKHWRRAAEQIRSECRNGNSRVTLHEKAQLAEDHARAIRAVVSANTLRGINPTGVILDEVASAQLPDAMPKTRRGRRPKAEELIAQQTVDEVDAGEGEQTGSTQPE
jgi:hypothetical protein